MPRTIHGEPSSDKKRRSSKRFKQLEVPEQPEGAEQPTELNLSEIPARVEDSQTIDTSTKKSKSRKSKKEKKSKKSSREKPITKPIEQNFKRTKNLRNQKHGLALRNKNRRTTDKEIRYLQSTEGFVLPRAVIRRMIVSSLNEFADGFRLTRTYVECLQKIIESQSVILAKKSNQTTHYCKRITVSASDVNHTSEMLKDHIAICN